MRIATLLTVLFATAVVFDLGLSLGATCPTNQPPRPNASADSQPQKGCSIKKSTTYAAARDFVHLVESGEHFLVAISTVVIAAFTIVLGFATALLFKATRDLVNGADDTARRQLRAYLNSAGLRFEQQFVGGQMFYRIHHYFINNASTPATHVTSWMNQTPVGTKDTTDFYLRDHDKPPDMVESVAVLGPRRRLHGELLLTATTVHRIHTEDLRHFVWGWVDYDDAFAPKTPRRRTEYCYRIRTEASGEPVVRLHSAYNAIDEDCYRKPSPRPPKSA